MEEPRAQRTLVKSPPELWAEVSDLEALAAHLGAFGEIRITPTEPETTVAWEGDRARGTVELEPSGWGTKVTLTAEVSAAEEQAAAAPEPVPEPPAGPRRRFWARLLGRRTETPAPIVEMPAAAPVPPGLAPAHAEEILCAVLDDLGAAHHRPFSR